MTAPPSQVRAAWRRLCPDITPAEIAALTAVGMAGTQAQVALRAYRAGRALGEVQAWLADVADEGIAAADEASA